MVNDQIGSPTYVNELSDIMIHLLNKKERIYHVTNSGSCTWYTFAKAIFKEAGFDSKLILPTITEDYGALAYRPRYSVLLNSALLDENINIPRQWNEALNEALKEFIQKEGYK